MGAKAGIGILLIGLGLTTMVGSITGNLAGMLAALFDPSDLATLANAKAKGKKSSITQGILNDIRGFIPGGTLLG